MKQCPTCGHKTNEDICSVCGSKTAEQQADGFRPATLPRRSKKYKKKYDAYKQSMQERAAKPVDQTPAAPQEDQVTNAQQPIKAPQAEQAEKVQQPIKAPQADQAPKAQQAALAPENTAAAPTEASTVRETVPTEPPAAHEAKPAAEPETIQTQSAPNAAHAEPKSGAPTDAHDDSRAGVPADTPPGILSPEALDEFLDDPTPEGSEDSENTAASSQDTDKTISAAAAQSQPAAAQSRDDVPGGENDAAKPAAPATSESDKQPPQGPLLTRRELVRKQKEEALRKNNRRYAQAHASRAARRWEEEYKDEPFAIVRGTCYYSALESETTVRGNFSKKRYKDDVLPKRETGSYEESEWYQGFDTAADPWGDYADDENNKDGVTYRAWFIILMLVLIWPIGLILMWVRKKFPLAVRIIITLVIAAGLAGEGYFVYKYGPGIYNQYLLGDSIKITYEISDDGDSTQVAPTTAEQKKALDAAANYVDTLSISRSGLIKQLKHDGYSTDVATYAADNCGANWQKEAKEMAEEYMDATTFTYEEMVTQLTSEGFTEDQAKLGARAAGLE